MCFTSEYLQRKHDLTWLVISDTFHTQTAKSDTFSAQSAILDR